MNMINLINNNKNVYYYIDKPIEIIKLYDDFQLAKVQYIHSKIEFFIDINYISSFPQYEKSISIKILGGVISD